MLLSLNPSISYKEKNGVYVFYYDFSYVFFIGKAAMLVNQILTIIDEGGDIGLLPDSFIGYLISKKIIQEE